MLVQGSYIRQRESLIQDAVCQIVSLDREHFLFAVQETPLFALEVMKSLSDRLRQLRF